MNRGPGRHWGVLCHQSKVWGGCAYSHLMELRELNESLMFSKLPKWKPQDVRLSPCEPRPWLSTLLWLRSSKHVRQWRTSGRGEGRLLGGSGQRKMLLLPTSGSQGAPWSRLDGDWGAMPPCLPAPRQHLPLWLFCCIQASCGDWSLLSPEPCPCVTSRRRRAGPFLSI